MVSSDDHAYCTGALSRMLQCSLHKPDWDLSGELLISMGGVGLGHLRLPRGGWRAVLAAPYEDGSLRGPTNADPATEKDGDDLRARTGQASGGGCLTTTTTRHSWPSGPAPAKPERTFPRFRADGCG
jgi:hypothetical protein